MTTTETVKLVVKPLEWKHEDSADFALSILGTYFITSGRPDGRYRLTTAYSNGALFASVEAAKAAAQADYERRIHSAIAPAGGEVEPVAPWLAARREALEKAKGINGSDFAGCLEPPNDLATSLAIIAAGYEFTLDLGGRLAALVAGDMGYAITDIALEPEVMKVIGPSLAALPNPAPSPVAATLKAIDNHLRVQQQVAARSNLVGYAAEFYAALRHTLPDAIRAALSPNGSDAE